MVPHVDGCATVLWPSRTRSKAHQLLVARLQVAANVLVMQSAVLSVSAWKRNKKEKKKMLAWKWDQIIHVGFGFSEFHFVHTFSSVPVQESFSSEHSSELFSYSLEHFLDSSGVTNESNSHL